MSSWFFLPTTPFRRHDGPHTVRQFAAYCESYSMTIGTSANATSASRIAVSSAMLFVAGPREPAA